MHIDHLKAAVADLGVSNDLVTIRSTLYAICSEFGIVSKLEVILAMQGGRRQALCFLRMENSEHEQLMMRYLEVERLSGYVVVIVDLPRESPTPRVGTTKPVVGLVMA